MPHLGLYFLSCSASLAAPAALPGKGASHGTPCTGGEVTSSTRPLWQPAKGKKSPLKLQGSTGRCRAVSMGPGWRWMCGTGLLCLFSKDNPSSPSALLLAGCCVGSSLLALKQQKVWLSGRENPTFFRS